ncbi:MAG: tRNA (adenosine(37)-N6)-threonylcarbamoyltransferase complex dimerization subunit type 1 TsaB [Cellvibrionaceae bacterium]|nr:tRNA (adenosine(37)-N6)-threonylcarbamoyltransferase complex dimerization subunit type 1 TsaB [Cellvibrionaceae bacterium]
MNILALEASTEVSSVALRYKEKDWLEYCEEPRSHSKVILPIIDKLLNSAGASLSDLDFIALTNGPGSFTGIRICVGIAQGLAYGAQLPVFTVSTLEAMALQATAELPIKPGQVIVPLLDARMGELYWAAFQNTADTGLIQLTAPSVASVAVVQQEIEAIKQNILCIGHGCALIDKSRLTDSSFFEGFKPRASAVILKGLNAVTNGQLISALQPGEVIEPLYLRNQVSWEKRKRLRT